MAANDRFSVDALHRGLVAVDHAATAGAKHFQPDAVEAQDRGRLYGALLQRGWVEAGPDTSITGSGELRLPPRLTEDGRRVLAALEQGELLAFVPHPDSSETAWSELIHALGPLSESTATARRNRSDLQRWGIDEGPASITRALQHAEGAGLRWSPEHETFVAASPPLPEGIFVEEIDEFERARTVSLRNVAPLLTNGRIDLLEDDVQLSLERILGETFHMTDHGGEECDMYSTHVTVKGRRFATAFLLKGRGARSRELQISDCGHNGDQIVRLLQTPAELFVVQYIGPVSQNVRKDLRGKIRERRSEGREATFCVIDGSDTARLLLAFGEIELPSE